jgi:serine-type D-Ala-D-Ala carboxypeptidase (penicillin-binding protein 5/6)
VKCKLLIPPVFAICLVFFGHPLCGLAASPPDLSAKSAILIDYDTGKVLYQKDAFERRPPASTTKILTAIVALEKGDLNHQVTASTKASRIGGSSIYLSAGESQKLRDLLYGVLLSSGNDASVAVAENLAGSEAQFARWMTLKARSLGAKDSNFVNCSGLPDDSHYTTARDLAVITRYALHNPVFAEMVKTRKKTIKWPGHKWERVMINHNKLLWNYGFADGVKTGYTRQAGKCLVSSATRDGLRLIAVVLNGRQMYEDSEKLFNYGFNNYRLEKILSPQEILGEVTVIEGVRNRVPVFPNRSLTVVIPKNSQGKLKVNLELQTKIEAPVHRLQKVGELEVKLGGKLIDTVPVVAANSVPKEGFWGKIWKWFNKPNRA